MAGSKIQWTDRTWNVTVGCTRVSAGCENCYAEKFAARLEAMGRSYYGGLTRRHADGSINWTGEVRVIPLRYAEPLRWTKPSRVFVDSMSDLWHEQVPDQALRRIWMTMILADKHTFQILTKRPERQRDWVNSTGRAIYDAVNESAKADGGPIPWPVPNIWLGTSTEDQRAADERVPLLLQTDAAVRFISAEPLLGPLDLAGMLADHTWAHGVPGGLSWVIVGGESGGPPERRLVEKCLTGWQPIPEKLQWVRGLRDQCQDAGVAFFFKQFGGPTNHAGGRALDGQTWDEFPKNKIGEGR